MGVGSGAAVGQNREIDKIACGPIAQRSFPEMGNSMKQSLGARTIIYPTPVLIVGTYDKAGKANMMAAAWGGICCSQPPCVDVCLRKATYSHGCIMERKAFTVNIPSEKYLKEADFVGIVSGRSTDKFAATGLTPVKSALVDAPYVEEFPLILECRMKQAVELGLHTLFVGEILDVKAESAVLGRDGIPEIPKLKPIVYIPDRCTYHGLGPELGKGFSVGKELQTHG
jgi:flavin reductase (DIM6/NTAB) family NADH-FMN oxidoreductase RutF